MIDPSLLDPIPLFTQLSPDQRAWLGERGSQWSVQQGEIFIQEGTPVQGFHCVLQGRVEFRTQQIGTHQVHVICFDPGDYFGHELMLMGTEIYLGSGYGLADSLLLHLRVEDFWEMMATCPSLTQDLFRSGIYHWQNYEGVLQSQARLISLGTLAAGLAHELNNPATAVKRCSDTLGKSLREGSSHTLDLLHYSFNSDQINYLSQCHQQAIQSLHQGSVLDPLEESDREAEIIDWLDSKGIDQGWHLAPTLLRSGFDPSRLDHLSTQVPASALADVLIWLEGSLNGIDLLTQIQQGTSRISQLVNGVKDYTFLDQAPLQEIDLHQGLEDTLQILGQRLERVQVIRQYELRSPRLLAYGREINQVWTHLISNALDAIQDQGEIRIRTSPLGSNGVVEIRDDGPGIPADIQPRIFDPFFTTKDVGQGTGLGLNICRRIIVGQHKGDIQIESRPGQTIARVCLPLSARDDHA